MHQHKLCVRAPAALIVLAGTAQALAAGPFGASFELSSLNGANGFVLNGIDADDYSGRSVSSAGDVNGDGVDDLIIGADRADPGGRSLAGESFVVFGRRCAGDLDGDGDTDIFDWAIFAGDLGCGTLTRASEPSAISDREAPCAGDVDGDSDTDIFDFGIFATDLPCDVQP